MKRLMEKTVFLGLVTAWFLAALPTMRSPSARKPTTDGVVRSPSAFTIVVGVPPSRTAIAELVVPRSIPRILLIVTSLPWVAWRAFADAHGASAFCSWHSVSPYAATYTKSKSIHIRFLIFLNLSLLCSLLTDVLAGPIGSMPHPRHTRRTPLRTRGGPSVRLARAHTPAARSHMLHTPNASSGWFPHAQTACKYANVASFSSNPSRRPKRTPATCAFSLDETFCTRQSSIKLNICIFAPPSPDK